VLSGRRKRTQEEKSQRPEDQKCAEISRVGKRKEGCCCAQLLLLYNSFLYFFFYFILVKLEQTYETK
jgi:hypothetical protein